jgi:membrane protease YdiL (CAAX protease family)
MKKFLFLVLCLYLSMTNYALANFHTVGWTGMFVPGGGRLLMGEYSEAAKEAAIEVGTFAAGYRMSPSNSFTIDGTPIDFPNVITKNYTRTQTTTFCASYDPVTHACLQYRKRVITYSGALADYSVRDANRPLAAALLQEFGLKYHMVNAFMAYRDQFNKEGGDPGQGIDQRPIKEMYKDPFRWEIISSPWVYLPIALSAAFAITDYRTQSISPDRPVYSLLSNSSKAFLAFDQMVMYPVGSAAPEETLYRGFIQNEFYYLVRSPYFAIPMSSALFALSHEQGGWGGAFVSGLYQGILAYKNNGNLAYGNAVHFWGVFILGIEAYLLTSQPAALRFNFSF